MKKEWVFFDFENDLRTRSLLEIIPSLFLESIFRGA